MYQLHRPHIGPTKLFGGHTGAWALNLCARLVGRVVGWLQQRLAGKQGEAPDAMVGSSSNAQASLSPAPAAHVLDPQPTHPTQPQPCTAYTGLLLQWHPSM